MRKAIVVLAASVAGRRLYRLYAEGAITVDLGVGRTVQSLGPVARRIAAPRELVFDVIAAPYLGRTSRALEQKLQVWERGSDMVLAAHFTPIKCGLTTTVDTVRFERPEPLCKQGQRRRRPASFGQNRTSRSGFPHNHARAQPQRLAAFRPVFVWRVSLMRGRAMLGSAQVCREVWSAWRRYDRDS